MSKAKKMEEMLKTMEVIEGYQNTYPSVLEFKKELLSKKGTEAESLYFSLLARIINEQSQFLPQSISNLPIEVLNAGMHFLHIAEGDSIRKAAVKNMGEFDACILFSSYHVSVGQIPETLAPFVQKLINISERYPDLKAESSTTWINHHDNWSSMYIYKENEFPCMRVRSLTEEARARYLEEVLDECNNHKENIVISLFGPAGPNSEELIFS